MSHEIYVRPDDIIGVDLDEQIAEMVWDSALILSNMVGAEPGSGEFIDIYQGLRDAFEDTGTHSKQAAFYALTLVQVMLESGKVALVSKDHTADSMRKTIVDLSKMAYRTVMFVLSMANTYGAALMLDNEEFDTLPSEDTTFLFPIDPLENKGAEEDELSE
jgi:hypothetical protein